MQKNYSRECLCFGVSVPFSGDLEMGVTLFIHNFHIWPMMQFSYFNLGYSMKLNAQSY